MIPCLLAQIAHFHMHYYLFTFIWATWRQTDRHCCKLARTGAFPCRAEQRIAARRETRLEPLCLHAGALKEAWEESSQRYLKHLHKHCQKLNCLSVNVHTVLKINVKSFKMSKTSSEIRKFIFEITGIILLYICLVPRGSLQTWQQCYWISK